MQTAFRRECITQPIAETEQVARILRRVVKHIGRERPHAPIGTLMLLVEFETEKLFKQRRETERANTEQLRRDTRVKQMGHPPPIILVQQTQIVVRVVQNHFDVAILEERAEFVGRADRQRIDDRVVRVSRQLQQVDPIDEAMETRPLGIECNGACPREFLEESVHGLGRIQVVECGCVHE